jgi:FkbM family methyltransferase
LLEKEKRLADLLGNKNETMKILSNGIAVLEHDSHISKWVEQSGSLMHDTNMLPLLNAYIHKGFTVIDVGGFIGDHTEYYVNRVGRTGKVYAFEPNPPAFECLQYNMAKYPNVACLNFGASDEPHGMGIATDPNMGASHAVEGDAVKCITIDSLNLTECHFIKMDCEGMEIKALDGAKATIAQHRPTMLIEVNRGALKRQGASAEALFMWLDVHGYTYRNIYAEQGLTDEQLDILCLPE